MPTKIGVQGEKMNIKSNVLKHYLSNVLFINGTAYAGKSTMCKLLAEKYNLVHCEENYNSDVIFKVINQVDQPNLSYFHTKKSWEEYLTRTPDQYESWINGNNSELEGFEVLELIRLSQDRKVIVDTNIPIEKLVEIANYHQIAIMLTDPAISSKRFFEREDKEKKFLLEQINNCENSNDVYNNFVSAISQVNRNQYDQFINSGMFVIERKENCQQETLDILANHFGLA